METRNSQSADKGSKSLAWIFRLGFSASLIAISIWGLGYSQRLIAQFSGPPVSPVDAPFDWVGALACWFVFFLPIALAGVWLLKGTLQKIGFGSYLREWFSGSGQGVEEQLPGAGGSLAGVRNRLTEQRDPHGLESLSPEDAIHLQKSAARAAITLGALAGALLVTLGGGGLVYLLFFFRTTTGSLQGTFAAARLSLYFAIGSGLLFLCGVALLRQTFTRENTSWLGPLHAFTRTVLRRFQATQPGSRPDSRSQNQKQLR